MKQAALLVAVTLAGCTQQKPGADIVANDAQHNAVVAPDTAPPSPQAPGTPGGLPDDRTPLAEPNGPIDPKSAEAAGQVVQQFAALIEQERYAEAAKLWSGPAALKDFDAAFKPASELHMQIGKPGEPEGAAGSIYVTVPAVFYGKNAGKNFSRAGQVILRRVNDVPGSTAEQRRWHIERIDVKAAT